jgi:hypothetical protein
LLPETRGDVAVHGFWRRGAATIVDVRVTDVDSASKAKLDPRKILAKQEREKKEKYVEHCLARR